MPRTNLMPALELGAAVALSVCLGVGTAAAESLSFRFSHLVSSPDGEVQVIELREFAGASGQHHLAGHTVTVINRAVVEKTFTFPTDLRFATTAGRSVAIGTNALEFAFGGWGPADYEMPQRFLPTDGGTLILDDSDRWEFGPMPANGHLLRDGADGGRDALSVRNFFGRPLNLGSFESVSLRSYRNIEVDADFMTAFQPDIDALESGRIPGWQRVGEFLAYTTSFPGVEMQFPLVPVCRWFVPPAGHFYSGSPAECDAVPTRFPNAVLETRAAFYAWLPDAQTGECSHLLSAVGPAPHAKLFRLVRNPDNGSGRFTEDEKMQASLVADGWVPSGFGPQGVALCMTPYWDF